MNKLTRLTVNLTKPSYAAMVEAVALTGESKTDVVNRALQLYALVHRIQAIGGHVYIREDLTKPDLQRLTML